MTRQIEDLNGADRPRRPASYVGQDAPAKGGTTMWTPAGKHLPENTGHKPFELILVEVKAKSPGAR